MDAKLAVGAEERLVTDLRLGFEGPRARARTTLHEGDTAFVALGWSTHPLPESYDEAEQWIQQLLSEADGAPVPGGLVTVTPKGPEVAADLDALESPESYVGYAKATGFLSAGGIREDVPNLYRPAAMLPLNHWALAGVWTVGGEFATLSDKSGTITYRFHARDVNLVLVPPADGKPVRFRVKIDGAPPAADHGTDVDTDGAGSVQEPRLYQLVRQKRPVADRTFEIEFLNPSVRAYVFIFG